MRPRLINIVLGCLTFACYCGTYFSYCGPGYPITLPVTTLTQPCTIVYSSKPSFTFPFHPPHALHWWLLFCGIEPNPGPHRATHNRCHRQTALPEFINWGSKHDTSGVYRILNSTLHNTWLPQYFTGRDSSTSLCHLLLLPAITHFSFSTPTCFILVAIVLRHWTHSQLYTTCCCQPLLTSYHVSYLVVWINVLTLW